MVPRNSMADLHALETAVDALSLRLKPSNVKWLQVHEDDSLLALLFPDTAAHIASAARSKLASSQRPTFFEEYNDAHLIAELLRQLADLLDALSFSLVTAYEGLSLLDNSNKSATSSSIDIDDADIPAQKAQIAKLPAELRSITIHRAFHATISIGFDVNVDAVISKTILQKTLPALVRFWSAFVDGNPGIFLLNRSLIWPKNAWEAVMVLWERIGNVPNRVSEMSECYEGLARLAHIFFPWGSEENRPAASRFEAVRFDIRHEPELSEFLLSGLTSSLASVRKQTLYFTKQVIKFCRFYYDPASGGGAAADRKRPDDSSNAQNSQEEGEESPERIFIWPHLQRDEWTALWERFFMLFESIQVPQVSIVEPILPLLRSFLRESSPGVWLGLPWWEAIMIRAFANDSIAVRRTILESIVSLDVENLEHLRDAMDFIFGPLMRLLDNSYLYSNIDASVLVSRFGENVAEFFARFIGSFKEESDRAECVLFYMEQVSSQITAAVPLIFFVQALLRIEPFAAIDDRGLDYVRVLSKHRSFHNVKARRLQRWQLLHVLLRLTDRDRASYRAISMTLRDVLTEQPLTMNSIEFNSIFEWLYESFSENYLRENLHTAIQRYFLDHEELSLPELKEMANRISTMVVFAFPKKSSIAYCCRPVFEQLAVMSRGDHPIRFIVACVLLFVTMNDAVAIVTKGEADLISQLDLGERLFEWMTKVGRTLLGNDAIDPLSLAPVLLTNSSSDPCEELDYESLEVLLVGLRLFIDKAVVMDGDAASSATLISSSMPSTLVPPSSLAAASSNPTTPTSANMLLKYLDILLFRSMNWLEAFIVLQLTPHTPESYAIQLLKISALELVAMVFNKFVLLGNHKVQFFTENSKQHIFACELEKPSGLTEQQWDSWSSLQIAFVAAKWNAIAALSTFAANSVEMCTQIPVAETFAQCLEALEESRYRSVVAILGCMRSLLSLRWELDPSLIDQSLTIMKDILTNHQDSPKWFYIHAEAFIAFLLCPFLLRQLEPYNAPDGAISKALDYIFREIGPRRRGLTTRMASALFKFWSTPEGRDSRRLYLSFIVELAIFGPNRDIPEERLAESLKYQQQQAVLGRDDLDDATGLEQIIEGGVLDNDYLVRVYMITLINHLDVENAEDRVWGLGMIDALLDFSMLPVNNSVSSRTFYPNTDLHRRKMRAWMAMIMLLPVIRDEHTFSLLAPRIWGCIRQESLTSIRYYMEWFLISGYLRFPSCVPDLLSRFDDFTAAPGMLISMITILFHVGLNIEGEKHQLWLYERAFHKLLPWILHSSATARSYVAWTFHELDKMRQLYPALRQIAMPPGYENLSRFISQVDHCRRFTEKLSAEPFLSRFHPILDYNLSFIFCDLPKMAGVATNELVSHISFLNVDPRPGNVPFVRKDDFVESPVASGVASHASKSTSSDDVLAAGEDGKTTLLQTVGSKAATKDKERAEERAAAAASQQPDERIYRDYQQKIVPWEMSMYDQEVHAVLERKEVSKRLAGGEIIVVASLVDRLPNLAGLSRTCEVLGATTLVIDNLRILDNSDFRNIAMTSDKWLDIQAVSIPDLVSYLEKKRDAGYAILAIEQSSQSRSLVDFRFPHRTCVVLGNERNGVPAEILHIVQECIEIPQFGKIRSLNVHVTGSIVMWEARRQWLAAAGTALHDPASPTFP